MLDTYIEDVGRRRKRCVVYSSGETDLPAQPATRNVTVERRTLPPGAGTGFATIHDGGAFLGAVSLAHLEKLLAPPVLRPGGATGSRTPTGTTPTRTGRSNRSGVSPSGRSPV